MAYILENFSQMDITEVEAKALVKMGLIVQSEDDDHYDFTSLVWSDLFLDSADSFLLVESILQYFRGELVDA